MAGAVQRYLQALCYTSVLFAATTGHSYLDEQQLKTKLLTNYDEDVRPDSPTLIETEFILYSLNDMSIERQELSVTGVLHTSWFDPRLAWNETEYFGKKSIMVPHGKIWQPQILVMNSVEKIEILGHKQMGPLRVYSTGKVKWMIPAIIDVYCIVKIISFPFDWQTATIMFVTWSFDVSEIYMTFPGKVKGDKFVENGEWELIEMKETISNVTSHVEVMQGLNVKLTLRRRWAFLFITLVVPAILNSILMAAVFKLPYESEKMSYSLTVLLSYIVLLTMVTDSLPIISTEISALQSYLTAVMCIGTVATLLTVWNVTVYNQNPKKPRPHWLISLTENVLRPVAFASPFRTTQESKISQGVNGGDYENLSKVNKKVRQVPSEHAYRVNTTEASVFSRMGSVSRSDVNVQVRSDYMPSSAATGEQEQGRKRSWIGDKYDGVYFEEPPIVQGTEDMNTESQSITWHEIAEIMDGVFFRLVSGCLVVGTVTLIVFLVIDY